MRLLAIGAERSYFGGPLSMPRKKKVRPESITGGYSAIPWMVIDSDSFKGATDKAKSLLFALMRQHNGQNNGHLHLAKAWLYAHGWTCDEGNRKAKSELVERELIIKTKQGGLNMGPDLYALTWLTISNYVHLDISPSDYRKGSYTLCGLPPTKRRKPPVKKNHLPSGRASTSSTTVTGGQAAGTTTVLEMPPLETLTGTTNEHNVITPLPTNTLHESSSTNSRQLH